MSSADDLDAQQPALLFIPDISGFTRFVTETEVSHSQHITRELLEILLESNDVGMEVSEVEGDAILFYRFGTAPSASELLAQVRKMFVNFHQHLRLYDAHRICQCGACRSAHNLTLKFVAHHGDVAVNRIKGHAKLFGKDVIVVHRLLKNAIPHHEYALFTDPVAEASPRWVDLSAAWADVEDGEETYEFGAVTFRFLALAPLLTQVKDVPVPSPVFRGKAVKVQQFEAIYEYPAGTVFQAVIELPSRTSWMDGVSGVQWISKSRVNRTGTRHRCLLQGGKSNPEVVTESYHRDEKSFCFSESDAKGLMSLKYIFESTSGATSRLSLEVWVKDNPAVRLLFSCLFRKKIARQLEASLVNLAGFLKHQPATASVDKAGPAEF